MKINAKASDYRVDASERLAGGMGAAAAKQDAAALLRRAVLANLLWENLAYETGDAVAAEIKRLVPLVDPAAVAALAFEARVQQKLRHAPLFLAREMARHAEHARLVSDLLPQIIRRPDELTEFVALYWQDGKRPLSKQVKRGLADAFARFDAYQFAKYNRDTQVKLRDVMFMVHPQPASAAREALYRQIADNTLPTPDTWEVALSAGEDKRATWERLIAEGKLGALAFVRNLRNMEDAQVDPAVIREGFATIKPGWLLPLNYLAAAKAAPRWERELEELMLRGLAQAPKLPGYSILIADVSGSMDTRLSEKSAFTRLDAGAAMAMLAAAMCERVSIYATAGNDGTRVHQTALLPPRRGFALAEQITAERRRLGGGGIFTRQCLEYVKTQERERADRIIVISDSQDCDWPARRVPAPFGAANYIIDVSAHTRGVGYEGVWTAEVSGWSEHFLSYIAALEGVAGGEQEEV